MGSQKREKSLYLIQTDNTKVLLLTVCIVGSMISAAVSAAVAHAHVSHNPVALCTVVPTPSNCKCIIVHRACIIWQCEYIIAYLY